VLPPFLNVECAFNLGHLRVVLCVPGDWRAERRGIGGQLQRRGGVAKPVLEEVPWQVVPFLDPQRPPLLQEVNIG